MGTTVHKNKSKATNNAWSCVIKYTMKYTILILAIFCLSAVLIVKQRWEGSSRLRCCLYLVLVFIWQSYSKPCWWFLYRASLSLLYQLYFIYCRFTHVSVGANNRVSDNGVLATSSLSRALEKRALILPLSAQLPGSDKVLPHVILGDKSVPLK